METPASPQEIIAAHDAAVAANNKNFTKRFVRTLVLTVVGVVAVMVASDIICSKIPDGDDDYMNDNDDNE